MNKNIIGLHWYWLIIILIFVYCIEFLVGLFIALIFEVLFIVYIPYKIEGKDWRFFIYD